MSCLPNDYDAEILQVILKVNAPDKVDSLTKFIDDNYDGLLGEKSQEQMLSQLEKEICEGDKIKSMDAVYIKKATKVMYNSIVQGRNVSDDVFKKLYKLNRIGAKKIERMPKHVRENRQFRNMYSHFHSHAGSNAQELFYRTNDARWGTLWFLNNAKSAQIVEESDKKHASYAHGLAGDAAKAKYKKTGNIEWAKRSHDAFFKSGQCAEEAREWNHATYAYRSGGDMAAIPYDRTGKNEWFRKRDDCYERSRKIASTKLSNR